jgi:hypothetical protein
MAATATIEGNAMRKPDASTAPKTWAKPEFRRIASGSAAFAGSTSVDGSGTQS